MFVYDLLDKELCAFISLGAHRTRKEFVEAARFTENRACKKSSPICPYWNIIPYWELPSSKWRSVIYPPSREHSSIIQTVASSRFGTWSINLRIESQDGAWKLACSHLALARLSHFVHQCYSELIASYIRVQLIYRGWCSFLTTDRQCVLIFFGKSSRFVILQIYW